MENYSFTCTSVKTRAYNLKPFGHFVFKWSKSRLYDQRPDWLYVGDSILDDDGAMPLSNEDEKRFIAAMKKHKTDIFVDDRRHPIFYTLTNSGMTEILHPRITALWNEQHKS